jgi:hypothetical protein
LVGGDPAEPHAERNEIGAHGVEGLRRDPPRRTIISLMALGVSRSKRRLADPAQSVQRRDRDPIIAAL